MKAAVWEKPGEPLHIQDVPDPIPRPSELILRVKDCGICGSDLHASEIAGFPPGTVLGHEFSGEIIEVGPAAVGDWRVGDRVCALPMLGCGSCAPCLTGDVMRCAAVRSTGLGDVPGAYAEYVLAGSHETFRLPDNVSNREGALVEPLAVGLHAVNEAKLLAGENVLILGTGPVGLCTALWARHLGAREVIASDLIPGRLELAGRNGATGAINPGKEELMPAFERLAGGPPDVIFECVGLPGLIQQCLNMAPPCCRIIVAGVCVQPDTIVPVVANLKELWLKFVTGYRKQDFAIALDMLRAERLTAGSMITDVVDLPGLPDAFEALKRPTTQCKVIVEP